MIIHLIFNTKQTKHEVIVFVTVNNSDSTVKHNLVMSLRVTESCKAHSAIMKVNEAEETPHDCYCVCIEWRETPA